MINVTKILKQASEKTKNHYKESWGVEVEPITTLTELRTHLETMLNIAKFSDEAPVKDEIALEAVLWILLHDSILLEED